MRKVILIISICDRGYAQTFISFLTVCDELPSFTRGDVL